MESLCHFVILLMRQWEIGGEMKILRAILAMGATLLMICLFCREGDGFDYTRLIPSILFLLFWRMADGK